MYNQKKHMTYKKPAETNIGELYSYQASILHARAYRNLKQYKNKILKRHGLSMMQWMVLGLIYDTGEQGIRMSDIAEQLDTTQAFATTTVNLLEAKQFVTRFAHETDKRSKRVRINPDHKQLIEQIELDVRKQLRKSLYQGVSRQELEVFLKVLSIFSDDTPAAK